MNKERSMKYMIPGLLAACLTVASVAHGSQSPDPRGLPACTSAGNDDVCRLPVRDGSFDAGALADWQRIASPSVGYDSAGNAYAATQPGAGVRQVVAINTGNQSADATYVLRFRALGESANGSVDARLALRDDAGQRRVELGRTTVNVERGEWSTGEMIVAGQPFGNPPHLEVTLANDSLSGTIVQIDDVYLLESVNGVSN